jgi:hypothetical protein
MAWMSHSCRSRDTSFINLSFLRVAWQDVLMGADADFVGRMGPELDVLLPLLDERARRLVLGAVARAAGDGGISAVAGVSGASWQTVANGAAELASGDAVPAGRVRRPGGGRKRLEDHDPQLRAELGELVEESTRGDPQSPLRWTTLSVRDIAAELTRRGHRCGKGAVARLLHADGYSLRGNSRTIEGKQHPDRDGQFRYISRMAKEYLAAGNPVISVDTKKKELVGLYAREGREWRRRGDPRRVRDHDFPDPAGGKAIPYGVYDIGANAGFVNVGTDHDTAAFAVESIRRWWQAAGHSRYPGTRRLLVTADAGGSNGYRPRAWKAALAELSAGTGLEITVCHFPPGTSKWNKIEHRLFCQLTRAWRGQPLTSHEVIISTIAAVTTSTGLAVTAALDTGRYQIGAKVSDAQLAALPLTRHTWHGDWNYTLHPQAPPAQASDTPAAPPPRRAGQPRPDLAWLSRPAITGMSGPALDALTAALTAPAAQLRQARLNRRRGGRPSQLAPGTGRKPAHTLTSKLLATILHDRHHLPQTAIAALCQIRPDTLSRNINEIRRLLPQAGHHIQPAPHTLATLDDLYRYAAAAGITTPPRPEHPHPQQATLTTHDTPQTHLVLGRVPAA